MGQFAMKRRTPPLNWLRAFEATGRHLSFTHAAAELNLSQVAVSKQVKQLEHHLREPLFIRHARSLEMTKTAKAYLPKVRDAFERLSDGTHEVFGDRRSKILTVRSAVGFSVNWLAPKLPDFYKNHPNIQLRIVSSVWNEEVGNPEFDLDIRYGTGSWSGMEAKRLTWDTITPVCKPVLARNGELSAVSDLARHPLIHVLGYEEGWSKWLRAADAFDQLDSSENIKVDNSLVAFELAASGCGIALARSSLAEPAISSNRLARPFRLNVPIEEAFYLVSSKAEIERSDESVFRNWLLQQAELNRSSDS